MNNTVENSLEFAEQEAACGYSYAYKDILKEDSGNTEAMLGLVFYYEAMGGFYIPLARDYCRMILKYDRNHKIARQKLTELRGRDEEIGPKIRFGKIVQSRGGGFEPTTDMDIEAVLSDGQSDVRQARERLKEGSNADAFYDLAWFYRAKDSDRAKEFCTRALETDSNHIGAKNLLEELKYAA